MTSASEALLEVLASLAPLGHRASLGNEGLSVLWAVVVLREREAHQERWALEAPRATRVTEAYEGLRV